MKGHASFLTMISITRASMGRFTSICRSSRRRWGRPLRTYAMMPPPWLFRSARWHLNPGTLHRLFGNDMSNLVSETNNISSKLWVNKSEISSTMMMVMMMILSSIIKIVISMTMLRISYPYICLQCLTIEMLTTMCGLNQSLSNHEGVFLGKGRSF